MQDFRDSFQHFLKRQDIRISDINQMTGIDRSTLYHFQRGSRIPPDMETVELLAQCMRISGTDLQSFKNAYEVSRYGEYICASRNQVRQLLFELSDHYPVNAKKSSPVIKALLTDFPAQSAIYGESNVDAVIEAVIDSGGKSEQIFVLEPILSDTTLRAIRRETERFPDKNIIHTVTLESRAKLTSQESVYNLRFFSRVIPLLLDENSYECYYQYGDISTLENQILPSNYVMNSSQIFVYDNAHRSGILYGAEPELPFCRALFEKTISHAKRFNQKPQVSEVMTYYAAEGWPPTGKTSGSYFFDIGFCSACVISREKDTPLVDLLAGSIGNGTALANQFFDYCDFVRGTVLENNWTGIFTKQGIDYFCETGILVELYFVTKDHPLPPKLRADFLFRWMEYVEKGKAVMLDYPGLSGAMAVAITVTPNKAFLDVPSENGYSSMAVITETSLVQNLYDYCEYCTVNKAVSRDRTIEYLNQKITELTQS